MTNSDWTKEFSGAITVCDLHGVVLGMNDRAVEQYQKYGGKVLVGKSLLDCHPEPARSKLLQLLDSGGHNTYTIEKDGSRKLIHQAPWFRNNQRCGMVELALEIPLDPPHYMR